MSFWKVLFECFLNDFFIGCSLSFVFVFRCFCFTFCDPFENSETVKNSTASSRELKTQGFPGSAFLYFLLFLGVWFLEGIGDGLCVILRWIWGEFGLRHWMNKVRHFRVDS